MRKKKVKQKTGEVWGNTKKPVPKPKNNIKKTKKEEKEEKKKRANSFPSLIPEAGNTSGVGVFVATVHWRCCSKGRGRGACPSSPLGSVWPAQAGLPRRYGCSILPPGGHSLRNGSKTAWSKARVSRGEKGEMSWCRAEGCTAAAAADGLGLNTHFFSQFPSTARQEHWLGRSRSSVQESRGAC